METFQGRVAVITGGASGIGLATARALAREGMKLVLADIEETALGSAVAEIEALGTEALGVRTDVARLADVQALADRTWERFGGCHVLFNNAGVAVGGPAVAMTHADWEWVINVNLWGPIHGIEAFLPRMVAQGEGGHILATSSFAGLMGNEGLSVYGVTKAGVINLIECLARELRPHNIGASVLCPMRVETKIYASARNRPVEAGGGTPVPGDARDRWASPELAGRVLPIDEVGGMVVRAIRENRLYIYTHPESRQFVEAHGRRLVRWFD